MTDRVTPFYFFQNMASALSYLYIRIKTGWGKKERAREREMGKQEGRNIMACRTKLNNIVSLVLGTVPTLR